jgi:hypothetical protein
MSYSTKKRHVDDLLIILTRFGRTDDSRIDPTWLSYKFDQVRAQMIIKSFQDDGVVDRSWLSDLNIQSLHEVNYADDPNVTFCCAEISKLFIPNVVSLRSRKDGNIDLGLFSIISACGTTEYTLFPMTIWKSIPKEHIRSKFHYYDRINTSLYINKKVDNLLIRAVLEFPEDGYIIESEPIASGSLVSGTVYVVKEKQIVYNSVVYAVNSTFTANATTTFSGNGVVYLNSQLQAIIDTQPYPCSADMARMIVLEILSKEFQIEASQITDVNNNSVDDQKEAKQQQ